MYRTVCNRDVSRLYAPCVYGLRIVLLTALVTVSNTLPATEYRTPSIAPGDISGTTDADGTLIIDLRTPIEYQVAHIPGARNIEPDDIEQHLSDINAADRTVLYCIIGTRTRDAEQRLSAHDVANIYHLEGGFGAWIRSGRPVEKGIDDSGAAAGIH